MKFTILALVGALASADARQLRTKARNLEGANNRAELDATADISFAKCIEVSVQTDNADEDMQTAILSGYAKPIESYAAFYPNTYFNVNEMMMVSLGDYVAAKVKSIANKNQNYCEACRQFEETCNPQQEEEAVEEEAAEGEEAEGAEGEGEGEDRKLATAINCDQCQSLGCYAEEEDNGQVDYDEQVSQFVENVAGCMQVENYADANGNGAYIGMACGSYGDAAEFAVFLDEDCTIETNQLTASGLLASMANDQGVSMSTVLSTASTYMQKAFTSSLSCEKVEYYDPYNADNNADGNADEAAEMSEGCKQITQDAVYIADCQLEQGDEEAAEDEDKWYNFDVEEAGNIEEACGVVNYKLNAGESFQYFYDEKTQGTTYSRDKKGSLTSTSEEKAGMSGGIAFLIAALVIAIVVAPVAWFINSKRNTQASESDYQGGTLS